MQTKKSKQLFHIVLEFGNTTRTIKVRATTREIAEKRALKRNPNATGVKHNA